MNRCAVATCPGCGVTQIATLIAVAGDVLLCCPCCGRLPYAAPLPATDPIVIAPGAMRPRRARPLPSRPPRPIGRPRKDAPQWS